MVFLCCFQFTKKLSSQKGLIVVKIWYTGYLSNVLLSISCPPKTPKTDTHQKVDSILKFGCVLVGMHCTKKVIGMVKYLLQYEGVLKYRHQTQTHSMTKLNWHFICKNASEKVLVLLKCISLILTVFIHFYLNLYFLPLRIWLN